MINVLGLISDRAGPKVKFDTWIDEEDPEQFTMDDIDLGSIDPECVSMVGSDDMVYGVSSDRDIGSSPPTAITKEGHRVWVFDIPVPVSRLKGSGLSGDLYIEDIKEFRGHYVNADDLLNPDIYEMGFGTSSETRPGKWRSVKSTKSQFIAKLSNHEVGHKDGQCFTQGSLLDGKRSSMSVVENFIMVFDIDIGMTEKEITDRLSEYGYEYLLYSTHSHLKTESKVKRDGFFKWSKEDDEKSIKVSSMQSYLTDFKKYLPRVVEGMTIKIDDRPTSNGVITVVEHNPMPKFRIVFFLSAPFVFQGKFNQKEKIKEWKERYHGLAKKLDLPIDKSCTDPGRLFYFGRHEKGADYSTIYAQGSPLVLDDIDRLDLKEAEAAPKDEFDKAGSDMGGQEHKTINYGDMSLIEWAASRAQIFNIQDALEDTGYDEFRDERSHKDGIHIQCPYEDGHTEAGGNGTYILNASDNEEDSGFIIHCMHDSCSGRDRLDFLKGLMEDGHLTQEDLKNDDFMCEETVEVTEESDEEGEPAKKKNKKVKKFSEDWFEAKIEDMDKRSTNQYNVVKHLVEAEEIPEGVVNDMLKRIATSTNVPTKKITAHAKNCEDTLRSKADKKGKRREGIYAMDEVRDVVKELNGYLYFANSACKVLRKTHDINGSINYEAKSIYDMNHLFSNQVHTIPFRGETKDYTSFELWLRAPDRNTCEGLTYQPRKPERIYKSDGGTVFLNTYSEFTRWEDEDPECSWDLMKDHIFEVLCSCDDDLYARFILFFANIIQNPDKKYAQTLIIKGEVGCGKSIVMDYMREIMGRSAVEINDSSSMTGRFNEHLAEKLLVVLDEGDFKKSMNKLKNIISSKTLEIEPKGLAKIWVNNCIRVTVTTNAKATVEVSLDSERRFFVLACSDEWVQAADAPKKLKEAKAAHFNAIEIQMEDEGGLDQMFYDLKTWNPEDYGLTFANDLMMAPMTEGLREESATSINSDILFVSSFIQNGFLHEVPSRDLDEIKLHDNKNTLIPRKYVQEHVYANIDKTRSKMSPTPNKVSTLLEKVAGITHVRSGKPDYPNMSKAEGTHAHCYVFPPRREMFNRMVKNGYIEKGIDIDG